MRISDWSSDVCSSDLPSVLAMASMTVAFVYLVDDPVNDRATPQVPASPRLTIGAPPGAAELAASVIGEDFVDRASSDRSAERRFGKACVRTCISRWSPDNSQKTKVRD